MNSKVCSISFLGNRILAVFCCRFFNRNSHSCNGEQSRKKWEETVASWRRGCTHMVIRDFRFRINIHQNKPVSQLHPVAVCSDFYTTVNRWCASLNYWIVPIFNSHPAYALFIQNTHKKYDSKSFTELALAIRNFVLRIPMPEANFSACLNIPKRH